jgi:TolA-binding protein
LLSVLLALFVLVAGVMTTLYVTKSSELNKTRKDLTAQVSDRDAKLTTQGKDLDQAKKDLQGKIDELNDVKQQLTGSQNTTEELKRQKQVIAKCIALLTEARRLADQGKTSQAQAKVREAEPVCTEADRYLT